MGRYAGYRLARPAKSPACHVISAELYFDPAEPVLPTVFLKQTRDSMRFLQYSGLLFLRILLHIRLMQMHRLGRAFAHADIQHFNDH